MAGLSQQAVISQMDSLLQKYSQIARAISSSYQHNVDNNQLSEATSAIHAMIDRFSYEGSSDLAGATVITKLDQKNVTAWLGLRNDAAHGHFTKYTSDQVQLLISSIRDFITRNPA